MSSLSHPIFGRKRKQISINISFTTMWMRIYTSLKPLVNTPNALHCGNLVFVPIIFTGTDLSILLNLNEIFTLASRLMTLLGVQDFLLSNQIEIPYAKGVFHVLLLILNYVSIQENPHLCVVVNPLTTFMRAK